MFDEAQLARTCARCPQDLIGDVGRVLWILVGTVGVVLLIACANVANLFLVRAEGRQQELADPHRARREPGRIARELLSESVGWRWRAARSACCSPRPASACSRGWRLPASADRRHRHRPGGAAVHAGDLGADRPVVRAHPGHEIRDADVVALKEGGRSASDAPGRHRTRNALVVAQIALALMLLIVSGLMIRTFIAMRQVDPGFVAARGGPDVPRRAFPGRSSRIRSRSARTYEQIAERLEQVPGVVSVGLSSSVTMDGRQRQDSDLRRGASRPVERCRRFGASRASAPATSRRWATRWWRDARSPGPISTRRSPVVVISENLAREYWGESGRRARQAHQAEPGRIPGGKSSASSATSATTA